MSIARQERCGDILDAKDTVDFQPKYFAFRTNSAVPLSDDVHASEAEAQAAIDQQPIPDEYETYGPVEFATNGGEAWWFKADGRPHILQIRFEQGPDDTMVVHIDRETESGGIETLTRTRGEDGFRFDLTVFVGAPGT